MTPTKVMGVGSTPNWYTSKKRKNRGMETPKSRDRLDFVLGPATQSMRAVSLQMEVLQHNRVIPKATTDVRAVLLNDKRNRESDRIDTHDRWNYQKPNRISPSP